MWALSTYDLSIFVMDISGYINYQIVLFRHFVQIVRASCVKDEEGKV